LILLASSSPRRKEILIEYNIPFKIIKSTFDEASLMNSLKNVLNPCDLVMRLSHEKAHHALLEDISDENIVIGADSIVCYNNTIYGKPINHLDAFNTLKILSGNTHEVITGYCLFNPKTGFSKEFYEISKVSFKNISDIEILAYLETGEPFDKAGAYAVQGIGAKFIKAIDGDINNIKGFPIDSILKNIKCNFGSIIQKKKH